MFHFELDKINGFSCNAEYIEVFDNVGKSFYSFPNDKLERITFNLPAGLYSTACDLNPLNKPLIYECPKLPMYEKRGKFPDDFFTEVMPNPNKCSVDIKTGLIILDPQREIEWEKPYLQFVIFHELGHVFYYTEWKCDLLSIKKMCEEFGFNPSQCLYSSYLCLSSKQQRRKDIAEKFLLKTKCYEQ